MRKYLGSFISALLAAFVILVFGFFYFIIFKEIPGAGFIGYIFITIAVISVGVTAAVLIQRIKEIKKGEEDDLGKYWFYYRKRDWNYSDS